MNILIISKRAGGTRSIPLTKGALAGVTLSIAGIAAGLFYAGHQLAAGGISRVEPIVVMRPDAPPEVRAGLEEQRQQVEEARRIAQENLNAMTLRLAQLQAHVVRLDALGQRLTQMAGLDDGEFDFSTPPAQGGPEEVAGGTVAEVPDFVGQLAELARQLEDRERQLSLMQTVLRNRNLQAELVPSGRPAKGFVSSDFGTRTDPFTGKREFHDGIDISGKEGAEVIAAAAGVVLYSGERTGYGNVVEIDHGNGYVTRYGHNRSNLVKVGDRIRKGQVIARLGDTGRSTGPHVHFEVLKEGKAVDPAKYLRAAK